jgi:hypothetical protein
MKFRHHKTSHPKSRRSDSKYPGLIIHETSKLKGGADVTLPPYLFVAADYRESAYGEAIIQHGYGHFLQYKKHGAFYYFFLVIPSSIWFAIRKNDYGWTEIEANRLADKFFGTNSLMGKKSKHFPLTAF